MPSDLPPHFLAQLKKIFLEELQTGVKDAQAAFQRLSEDGGDRSAIEELASFFHRVAGSASSVGFPLLGHLAAVSEHAAVVALATPLPREEWVPLFAEALAGAATVLEERSQGEGAVLSLAPAVKHSTAAAPSQPSPLAKVLVVDDDPVSAAMVRECLKGAGLLTLWCSEPTRALETIQSELPDLIVLDVVMPGVSGFDLCRKIRSHPAMTFTPIIFLTRKNDLCERVRGLDAGGNDYIAKPFEPTELVARVQSQLARVSSMRELAIRDGLTHCFNHKYFKERVDQELARARRYGGEITLCMLDIDHFKRINDTHGHLGGDEVLAQLANLLLLCVRTTDMVARYGGEEFGILLIQATPPEAGIISGRIRAKVAEHRFKLPASPRPGGEVQVTVSIGVAQRRKEDTVESLLSRADAALYQAKRSGRDQVRTADVA